VKFAFIADMAEENERKPRDERDADHVRNAAFRYIETYYNRTRIQKELGYLSPAEYESGFDKRMAEAA
jgi:transposase InsO family protein